MPPPALPNTHPTWYARPPRRRSERRVLLLVIAAAAACPLLIRRRRRPRPRPARLFPLAVCFAVAIALVSLPLLCIEHGGRGGRAEVEALARVHLHARGRDGEHACFAECRKGPPTVSRDSRSPHVTDGHKKESRRSSSNPPSMNGQIRRTGAGCGCCGLPGAACASTETCFTMSGCASAVSRPFWLPICRPVDRLIYLFIYLFYRSDGMRVKG